MYSEIPQGGKIETKTHPVGSTRKKTVAVVTIAVAIIIAIALIGYFSYQRHQTRKNLGMILAAANEALATQNVDPTIRTTGRFVSFEKFVKSQIKAWLSSREAYLAALRQFPNDFSAASLPTDDAELSDHFKNAQTLSKAAQAFISSQADMTDMQKWQEACDKAGLSQEDRRPFLLLLVKSSQEAGPDLEMMRAAQKRLDESLNQFLTFLVENRDSWKVENGELTYISPTVDKQGRKLASEVVAARRDLGKSFDHTSNM